MGEPVPAGCLFEYGIHLENSDIRCHVGPAARSIFVFRTALASALLPGKYRKAYAGQPGVEGPTGLGYLVPWRDVPDIRAVAWSSVPWWEWFDFHETTSEKGKKAVGVTAELMRLGRFPLWLDNGVESKDVSVQIRGTDMIIFGRWRIQVKCDWLAGDVKDGGSGNLFLQIAERNPLRRT